jgi:hypothetical protein
MKKIILLLYTLLHISCVSQSVEIRHISSWSDKPIFTLIISDNEIIKKAIEERFIKVDKDDLNILLDFIKNNETKAIESKNIEYPYGAFVIKVRNPHSEKSYVLVNGKISSEYFRKLIIFLDTNDKKNLAEEFRKILIRLE